MCAICGRAGSMVFDSDVLIWVFRRNLRAAKAVDRADLRSISIVSYMELLQGARDKGDAREIKRYFATMQFRMLPLTESIGHRAATYIEQYALSFAMRMPDALIAASAVENREPLLTGNQKHFRVVRGLQVVRFKP